MMCTGCGIWRGRDCGGNKRVCKNCDEGEFKLCKVGLYSGTTGLSHAQVLDSLSLLHLLLSYLILVPFPPP